MQDCIAQPLESGLADDHLTRHVALRTDAAKRPPPSGKALTNCFCNFDCFLKRRDRLRLVIPRQGLGIWRPLWVKSRHMQCKKACPLYPQ